MLCNNPGGFTFSYCVSRLCIVTRVLFNASIHQHSTQLFLRKSPDLLTYYVCSVDARIDYLVSYYPQSILLNSIDDFWRYLVQGWWSRNLQSNGDVFFILDLEWIWLATSHVVLKFSFRTFIYITSTYVIHSTA